MKKILFAILLVVVAFGVAPAQIAKPWKDWSKKDAEKILNDSAWGRTQEDTDASQLMFSPTANDTLTQSTKSRTDASGVAGGPNTDTGAKNQALSLKYRIRFFSAKPVRQAFARIIVLGQTDEQKGKQMAAKLQTAFVDLDYGDYIVVAVAPEGTDRRQIGPADQALRTATVATLKNGCFLERKDGKRMFLVEYQEPTPDQTGAKFIFSRSEDGKPFITSESDVVRFVAEINDKMKLNMKFKVADMIYDGKLEY